VGMTILASRAIVAGADAAGWSLEPVVGPLVVGWVGLAIVASATHLVPAVGPRRSAGPRAPATGARAAGGDSARCI
jgi:hypothetical protein